VKCTRNCRSSVAITVLLAESCGPFTSEKHTEGVVLCVSCLNLLRALRSGCCDSDAIVKRSELVSGVVKGHTGNVSPSVRIICQNERYM
jgi:hypothetical protein